MRPYGIGWTVTGRPGAIMMTSSMGSAADGFGGATAPWPPADGGSLAVAEVYARAPFRSRHSRWVGAPPADTRRAVDEMTVGDLRLAPPLLAARALPARLGSLLGGPPADLIGGRPAAPAVNRGGHGDGHGPEARRASERDRPFLDQLTALGFARLHDDRDGLAVGMVAQFWNIRPRRADGVGDAASFAAFAAPGWAKAVTTITVTPAGDGSRLATTTAVMPTDAAARLAFGRYWLVIRVPSGLIRREWLAAIARRAVRP
jgi:hypothetical protein